MRRSETPYNPGDVRDCLVIIGKHRDISENYNNTRRIRRTQRLIGETRRNTSEKGRKPRKRRRAETPIEDEESPCNMEETPE